MQQVDKIISARWVLPIAPQNVSLENHAVVVHGDRIIDILPENSAKKLYQTNEWQHLENHVLIPGLINAHTHATMSLFRGLADDLKLMDWLNNHIWPAENDILNEQSIADGSLLAFAEMLRGGITCFNDMYFYPNTTAKAAVKAGIRGKIGYTVMSVPTTWAKTEEEYVQKAVQAHEERVQNDLISWSIAPHACYTNSDASLIKAKELSSQWNIPINMHVHETLDEIKMEMDRSGKRPLKRLNDLGLLDEKFIAVHMVHLNAEDIQLIKKTRCHVVHCPESNLKLASGFAPVWDLLQQNINVAIGTDGAASNNDLDLLGEMKTASLLAKALQKDPTALPAAKILEMATLGGAKALGLEHEIGSIEAGKKADLTAIDLSSFLTQPVYNPISHLIYAANRMQVSDVWVNGKQVLKNGLLTQLDVEEITQKARLWAKKAAIYSSNPILDSVAT